MGGQVADSNKTETPDPVEKVLEEFDRRKGALEALCIKTKGLIEDCLKHAGLRCQSVQARVKKGKKLQQKYLDKNYRSLDDITDQAGVRVITYYDDEVDRAADAIKREFTIIPEKSIDKRETDPDKFGYYALNLVCMHKEHRKTDVQWKEFADLVFEIQVTSVLRHAWSEMEHPWYDLKESYPPHIKRRYYRVAALLEIAEAEFLDLRKLRADHRHSVDVQVEAAVPGVAVDAISLRAFIVSDPLAGRIAQSIAAVYGIPTIEPPPKGLEQAASLAAAAGLTTLQKLRDSLKKHEADVLEYFRRAVQTIWVAPAPNAKMATSAGVYHLAVMLLAAQSEDKLVGAMKAAGMGYSLVELRTLATIAREILGKGAGGPPNARRVS